jgi:hypothetical protein
MKISNLGAEYFVEGEWKIINAIQWKSILQKYLRDITYITYKSTCPTDELCQSIQ